MAAERAFVMVWDGLRPDYVTPTATPNLWRLAQQGVWFERSHAVYPTLTRANSPAISTGCRPGRAGVPGNTFCLPSTGSLQSYTSGDAANLQRLADADGRPVLLVETLADRVHRAGGRTVVVGSGSPGCTWLQHPRAPETGDLVIGQGLENHSTALDELAARFGPPPKRRVPATEWTTYFTRIICEYVVPEHEPTLLVFWHTDPDHTAHPRGHAAPETAQALRDADANLGAVLESYERLGLRASTDVLVTSDHGSSSIARRVKPAHDLSALLANGIAADNGGSVFVYSSDPAAVSAVRALDYAGPIFTRDGATGTLPLSAIGLDGPRAPDVVFSLAWSEEVVDGLPGAAAGSHGRLLVDHGTISPYDVHNTLVAQGPDFKAGWRDPAPVGNIDIAPSLVHLLSLGNATPFDGRILSEAFVNGPADPPMFQSEDITAAFSANGHEYVQRVTLERVGETFYVARGTIEPRR